MAVVVAVVAVELEVALALGRSWLRQARRRVPTVPRRLRRLRQARSGSGTSLLTFLR